MKGKGNPIEICDCLRSFLSKTLHNQLHLPGSCSKSQEIKAKKTSDPEQKEEGICRSFCPSDKREFWEPKCRCQGSLELASTPSPPALHPEQASSTPTVLGVNGEARSHTGEFHSERRCLELLCVPRVVLSVGADTEQK